MINGVVTGKLTNLRQRLDELRTLYPLTEERIGEVLLTLVNDHLGDFERLIEEVMALLKIGYRARREHNPEQERPAS